MPPALLDALLETCRLWREPDHSSREQASERTLTAGNRFTAEAVIFAVNQQIGSVSPEAVKRWIGTTPVERPRAVGVFNPGNIPFAGFQDFLATILTGNQYLGKLSSRSPYLLPAFVNDLQARVPQARAAFMNADAVISESDALIITGADETVSRLKRRALQSGIDSDNILTRGHRYSCAIIASAESEEILERLAEDVLLHEGLGCRSPAIVWAPRGESPDPALEAFAHFRAVFPAHPDTAGSLQMQIAFHTALRTPMGFGDDGSFLVTKGDPEPQQPGHIRWVEYSSLNEVEAWLAEHRDFVQLASVTPDIRDCLGDVEVSLVDVGHAQRPELGWHQDGKDVVKFLRSLR